jgi:hypothetical protein
VAADRAAHENRTVERELGGQRDRHLHEEVARQPVFLRPPLAAFRRQRLRVIREIVRDHPEVPADVGVLEQVAPLTAVGARGVLKQERDSRARLLEVDAVLHAVDREVDVAAGGRIEASHQDASSDAARRARITAKSRVEAW